MLEKNWLEEGFILQYGEDFVIASGPFQILQTPHPTEMCFYTPDFFSKKIIFQYSQNKKIIQRSHLLSFLEKEQKKPPLPLWKDPDFKVFENQFKKFQEAEKKKELKKIVPVFFSKTNNFLNTQHRAYLLKNAIQQKEGFVYGMWTKYDGVLGLTPEYLFKKEKQNLKTMALAGTGKKNLLSDPKEIKEHKIVVDSLCKGWKDVKNSSIYEWNFCGLKHLRTDIIIQTHLDFSSIVKKLHPTPALGGYPKQKAWNWLLQHNEDSIVPRKRFGAPLAVHFSPEESFCIVAIRNIQWNQKFIFLGSGGGWIQQSNLEKEWNEIQLKRDSTFSTLWGLK